KYTGGMDPLVNPANDGALVRQTLERLGFQVTLLNDADQRSMKRAIADFGSALEEAGPETTALFYYAGHGLQVNGFNYLIPVNADIRKEADVDIEGVAAENILRQMEFAMPKTSIVILDACRNNPLTRSFRSGTRGLARMDAPNGSFVAYSTAPGDVAADGTGANSPFALAFAAEVVKPNQAIEESFRNIRVRVSSATQGAQTPWDSSSLMAPFYFAGRSENAAMTAVPAAPAYDAAADQALWNSVANSSNPDDYAAYLAAYPTGNFATLAQSRMAGLQQAASRGTQSAALPPEPAFDSPLPDGTIILSRKVAQALDGFQSATTNSAVIAAYFYVSSDGRHYGASACTAPIQAPVSGTSSCPKGVWGIALRTRFDGRAADACAKSAGAECIRLFVGAEQKATYKTIDDHLAGN
ncbi:hypothetical protein A8950_0308, partial [Dongia mobilis]